MINLLIEVDDVEVFTGEPRRVDVPRDGGGQQRIYRCPACAIALYYDMNELWPRASLERVAALDRRG